MTRPPLNRARLLLVGHGYAGQRFARAVEALIGSAAIPFYHAAVADPCPAMLERALPGWIRYCNLDTAIREWQPQIAIVAASEGSHFTILKSLDSSTQCILCEKPLTASWNEAASIARVLEDSSLSVNFVERQSLVLRCLRDWLSANVMFQPVRVEFFWGKHRMCDPRHTIGVLSEISHPLDLVDYIFGFEEIKVDRILGVSSDFWPGADQALDSLSVVFNTERYRVVGHSSFVWSERWRRIVATMSDGHRYRQIVLDFDQPAWDCDSLQIFDIDRVRGQRTLILHQSVTNTDVPPQLLSIYKVSEFVRKSIDAFTSGTYHEELATLSQALKIQRHLEQLSSSLSDDVIRTTFAVPSLP